MFRPMRKLFICLMLSLSLALQAHAMDIHPDGKNDFINISNDDLKVLWGESDEECRGYSGTDIRMHLGCAKRDVLTDILEARGWCLSGPLVDTQWERCIRL